MNRRKIELKKGDKFDRLTIIEEVQNPNSKNVRFFLCSCSCGNTKIVGLSHLNHGHTKSCGCYKKDVVRDRSETHGLSKHSLYKTWVSMKERCLNPNHKFYKNYGGRGIKVCDRWINSFPNFLLDMGDRPNGFTLDRINNDGNYEPSNCRWATKIEQINNRRNTKLVKS